MIDETDPFAMMADIIDPPDAVDWEPLDHQIPPTGDWFYWMLMGGRGAGKTAAAARYCYEHAMGPPCLPEVPGGHWMGLVGPTLGDAVTSGVEGPSGLRKWDRGLKVQQKAGGANVTFSNGASMKLFGAYKQEDVERFRSGGNRCFLWCVSADTLIMTELGERPIIDVKVGDMVWTRDGLRKVLDQQMTDPASDILEIELGNGRKLRCSPAHRIYLEGGKTYREARDLRVGDMVAVCNQNSSTMTESNTTSKAGSTITEQRKQVKGSIEPSMSERSARSRQGMRSTTSTETSSITMPPILSRSLQPSISESTRNLEIIRLGERGDIRHSSVSIAATPSQGVVKARSHQGSVVHYAETEDQPRRVGAGVGGIHAHSAEKKQETRTTALRSAIQQRGMTSSETASIAESTSSIEIRSTSVVGIVALETQEPVYHLSVEGEHEYISDSVLSKNCEEMAAWRYLEEAWEQIRYGLRVGPNPHCIISTTPKARRLIKELVRDARENPGYGVFSTASTFSNPHLDERVKTALKEDYDGTRMGRQELYAEILEDIEGALWTPEIIDEHRIDLYNFPDNLDKIVVGVDPQAKEGGDNTGIIVAGIINTGYMAHDTRSHGFILGDYSRNGQPLHWAKGVDRAFQDFMANEVVAEINNGGDMVATTLRTVNGNLPIHVVHATRGKDKRAEPISALYEQGRVHHVGMFPELEDEMTGWDPIDTDPAWSPDRMDAMVWALTRLMGRRNGGMSTANKQNSLRGRR